MSPSSYFQPVVRLKLCFQQVHVHRAHVQHIFTDTLRWWQHRSQTDTLISHRITDCMNDLILLPSLSEQDEDKIARGEKYVRIYIYIYIFVCIYISWIPLSTEFRHQVCSDNVPGFQFT